MLGGQVCMPSVTDRCCPATRPSSPWGQRCTAPCPPITAQARVREWDATGCSFQVGRFGEEKPPFGLCHVLTSPPRSDPTQAGGLEPSPGPSALARPRSTWAQSSSDLFGCQLLWTYEHTDRQTPDHTGLAGCDWGSAGGLG